MSIVMSIRRCVQCFTEQPVLDKLRNRKGILLPRHLDGFLSLVTLALPRHAIVHRTKGFA
jgi:hypothetical protein